MAKHRSSVVSAILPTVAVKHFKTAREAWENGWAIVVGISEGVLELSVRYRKTGHSPRFAKLLSEKLVGMEAQLRGLKPIKTRLLKHLGAVDTLFNDSLDDDVFWPLFGDDSREPDTTMVANFCEPPFLRKDAAWWNRYSNVMRQFESNARAWFDRMIQEQSTAASGSSGRKRDPLTEQMADFANARRPKYSWKDIAEKFKREYSTVPPEKVTQSIVRNAHRNYYGDKAKKKKNRAN